MSQTISYGSLKINAALYDFISKEAIPHTGVSVEHFWNGFEKTVHELAPINQMLLDKRDAFQEKLDAWYLAHQTTPFTPEEHQRFLKQIGYLVEVPQAEAITTLQVDPEISDVSAPQLVVPADNARYALNAANARWGSLFDVFYGTDMIDEVAPYEKKEQYNPARGAKVFELAFTFLDQVAPLKEHSYTDIHGFTIQNQQLYAILANHQRVALIEPEKFVGYTLHENEIASLLLKNNGLHVEIQIDKQSLIGKSHPSGIKDVIIESALSAIQDCEDSVAAVDAEDKLAIYRNWNGLMKGDLSASFENKGKTIHRTLNPDKTFTSPNGELFTLKGRVLLLIRNVGIHMYSDAITCQDTAIPEGFLDAFVTTLCAMHDLQKSEGIRNSVKGSVYIVKPKCHGPEEIAFINTLFGRVEDVLALPRHTIKMGIMDEERRTTINLEAAILQAKERVFFINTGFLDRTGDEIHSCMELGAVVPKEAMKKEVWLKAYEDHNVDVGLSMGFKGKAQIGKGMWTMPDLMKKMVELKIAHPKAGATTAWVPSPTAATLHALHYHYIDVQKVLQEIAKRPKASLDAILMPPLLHGTLSKEEITQEIENNIQSILGYVVRWIDQGIGCSKVPDINNVELMEDRATLRISSQHLANWLHHGIVTHEEVKNTFEKMAVVVDKQNSHDKNYRPMAAHFEKSIAFQAALDLVFKGRMQPNGYTEFILHDRRKEVKKQRSQG
ncbi:MAG: malate synthase [Proteobacteria bacterium]|nr:malate synthase [Pseudomonadota bacterium]